MILTLAEQHLLDMLPAAERATALAKFRREREFGVKQGASPGRPKQQANDRAAAIRRALSTMKVTV